LPTASGLDDADRSALSEPVPRSRTARRRTFSWAAACSAGARPTPRAGPSAWQATSAAERASACSAIAPAPTTCRLWP
jgi:hypothetical protein